MNTKQYYFIYKGKIYETGTVIKIKPWHGGVKNTCVEELYFEWYVPESDLYVLEYKSPNGRKGIGMTGEQLKKYFLYPTNQMDKCVTKRHQMRMENDKLTFGRELAIDGMLIAWLWYIVLMAVTFIFNGRIFYWAVISSCFFLYRYTKLKEEGYK